MLWLWLYMAEVQIKDFRTDVKVAETVMKVKVIRDFAAWMRGRCNIS